VYCKKTFIQAIYAPDAIQIRFILFANITLPEGLQRLLA